MLLVILGAGASYDSDPARPASTVAAANRPPLASELFANRFLFGQTIDRYPPVRPLVPRLRAAATDSSVSLEHEFERIASEARDRIAVRRQLAAARYYLHDVVEQSTHQWALDEAHGVTNHHLLVDRLGEWIDSGAGRVCYLTFNYDTLLETACYDSLGMDFSDIGSYVRDDRLRIIKLHGSVNWRRISTNVAASWTGGSREDNSRWLLDRFVDIELSGDYEVGDPYEFSHGRLVPVPAIAVPTERKTEADFDLPTEHLRILRDEVLPQVSRVLVIGWKGRESHWWDLWRGARPTVARMPVEVVDANVDTAQTVAATLQRAGIGRCRPGLTDGRLLRIYGATGLLCPVVMKAPRFQRGGLVSLHRWLASATASRAAPCRDGRSGSAFWPCPEPSRRASAPTCFCRPPRARVWQDTACRD